MPPDKLRNLLSSKQLKLISIISDHLQKEPSTDNLRFGWLKTQANMTEQEVLEVINIIGSRYASPLSGAAISVNLGIVELSKQLNSKPVVDHYDATQKAWKTKWWLGAPAGLAVIASGILLTIGTLAYLLNPLTQFIGGLLK